MARARAVCSILFLFLFVLFNSQSGFSYSVLTHEQLIDLAWKDSIIPMLLSRYPHTTPAELERVYDVFDFTPEERLRVRAAILATAIEKMLMDRINADDALIAGFTFLVRIPQHLW